MYKVEKTDYGVRFTISGFITKEEMSMWAAEAQELIPGLQGNFGVIADLREMKPLPQDAQELMEETQKMYKKAGMIRSCVVLNNSITTMQFKRIGKKTGVYDWERYIDASIISNWEQVCEAWVLHAKDPDKLEV